MSVSENRYLTNIFSAREWNNYRKKIKYMPKKISVSLLVFVFSAFCSFAQSAGIPDRPSPPRLVNNFSIEFPDFLSAQEVSQLEKKLEDFANQTSNQIVIVIVDDLTGYEPWDYATQLGAKWKVGQEKFDNGIVILVKPTGTKGKRKSFIAIGSGLEGAIPDITANRIVENELNPNLANGNIYEGFQKTTDVLISLAKGEYNSDAYGKKHSKRRIPLGVIIPLIFIILFIILRSSKGGGGRGGLSMASGFFLGSMMGSGRGFGGGGSSGGFGGFGGGGFGGGGSGGDW